MTSLLSESKKEEDITFMTRGLLELLRVRIRCDASGGELLVIVKVIGVHVLYYEERFK
jgi:hypothetical protein